MSSHASIGAERKIEHTGFQSADPPLLLRYVDNENVALALTGVIKRDSFSVGRPFGRSVATAQLGALPNTAPIRVRSRSQHWIFVWAIADEIHWMVQRLHRDERQSDGTRRKSERVTIRYSEA